MTDQFDIAASIRPLGERMQEPQSTGERLQEIENTRRSARRSAVSYTESADDDNYDEEDVEQVSRPPRSGQAVNTKDHLYTPRGAIVFLLTVMASYFDVATQGKF